MTDAVMAESGRHSSTGVANLPPHASESTAQGIWDTPHGDNWQDMLFLSQAAIRLTESLDESDIRELAVRLPLPYLADWCALQLVDVADPVDTAAGIMTVVVCAHVDRDREPRARVLWQRAVQSMPHAVPTLTRALNAPMRTLPPTIIDIVPEPASDKATNKLAAQLLAQLDLTTALYVPLVADRRAIGVLTLGSVTPGRYGPREVALAVEYANRVASVLDRAQRYGRAVETLQARDTGVAESTHDAKQAAAQIARYAADIHRRLKGCEAAQPDTQAMRACNRIEESARSLNEILDGVVSTSTRDVGEEAAPGKQETDLVAIVRHMIERYGELAAGHAFQLDAGSLDRVIGNWHSGALKRILDNLLCNAVTFSQPDETITVRVWRGHARAEPGMRRREWAYLQVRDQGVGIPTVDLPRIFELYYRGSNVRKTIPGAGVGLSSVLSLVRKQGGLVRVASELGEGTSLTIMLPLDPAPRAAHVSGRTQHRNNLLMDAGSLTCNEP